MYMRKGGLGQPSPDKYPKFSFLRLILIYFNLCIGITESALHNF